MADNQAPGPQVNPFVLLLVMMVFGLLLAAMCLGTALVIFT
jgi:uncharacterized membrane protein YraQ (UPF0718 family)